MPGPSLNAPSTPLCRILSPQTPQTLASATSALQPPRPLAPPCRVRAPPRPRGHTAPTPRKDPAGASPWDQDPPRVRCPRSNPCIVLVTKPRSAPPRELVTGIATSLHRPIPRTVSTLSTPRFLCARSRRPYHPLIASTPHSGGVPPLNPTTADETAAPDLPKLR